ncbi:MAG: HAD domain-containing protein [Massilia sp.]
MKTIVFLDFDDVLAVHPEYTSSEVVAALKSSAADQAVELWENVFQPAARANLRTLHDEFAPQFVISSSWATYMSQGQVSEVLARSGLGFVAEALHGDWRSAIDVGAFRVTDAYFGDRAHPFRSIAPTCA